MASCHRGIRTSLCIRCREGREQCREQLPRHKDTEESHGHIILCAPCFRERFLAVFIREYYREP
jgi:hypothetical protein